MEGLHVNCLFCNKIQTLCVRLVLVLVLRLLPLLILCLLLLLLRLLRLLLLPASCSCPSVPTDWACPSAAQRMPVSYRMTCPLACRKRAPLDVAIKPSFARQLPRTCCHVC